MKKSNINCPSSITKSELRQIKKEFPKITKKRKSLKEYINSLKNYEYVEAELYFTRNKLDDARNKIEELEEQNHILERANNNKMDKIFKLQQQIVDYEKLYELKLKDLELIKNKLVETEERRRSNAGKVGGLIVSNKNLNNRVEMYRQVLESKDRDLNQAAIIIKSLNDRIRSLKNKPSIEELKEYDRTRKSPRKNR